MGAGASVVGEENGGGGAGTPPRSSDLVEEGGHTRAFDGSHGPNIDIPHAVLNEPRWCGLFKKYLTDGYVQDLMQGGTMGSEEDAQKLRTVALNFVAFWLDLSDCNFFADSTFRSLRLDGIYDRYLGHGAKHKVPLGRWLTDEMLLQKDSDTGVSPQLLQGAQNEAFEYLQVEVFPKFMSHTGPNGYMRCSKLIRASQRARRSIGSNSSLAEMSAELCSLLATDRMGTTYLKEFMASRGMIELILFYLEAVDFEEMFVAVLANCPQAAQTQVSPRFSPRGRGSGSHPSTPPRTSELIANRHYKFFLMRSNKIYDKYLKLGSPLRGFLQETHIRDLVTRMGKVDSLDPHIFSALKDRAFEDILFEHYQDFKESPSFQAYRQKINQREGLKQQVVLPMDPEANRQELLTMLQKHTTPQFQQYLTDVGDVNYLYFWFEVEDYKSIPIRQASYVQGRAQKIFDKFIRRGAPLELSLDSMVRNDIITVIDNPDLNVYQWAQQVAFDVLLLEDYPRFRQTELYESFLHDKKNDSNHRPAVEVTPAGLTLEEILSMPTSCAYFKKWCDTEFCVEAVVFWLEVEEFKRLPRSEFLRNRSRKIINKFIKDGAQLVITISQEARNQVMERAENPGPTQFQLAQQEIFIFMETFLLPKYRQSEDYHDMINAREEGDNRMRMTMKVAPDLSMDTPATPHTPSINGTRWKFTLKDILASSTGSKFFKDFCVDRHCEENLLFWLETEDFKSQPGSDFMKLHAKKIAVKFVSMDARTQVNLDHKTRETLLANINNPTRNLFQKAQDEIYKVIERDCFPPFLLSDQYKRYIEFLNGAQENNWQTFLRRTAAAVPVQLSQMNPLNPLSPPVRRQLLPDLL